MEPKSIYRSDKAQQESTAKQQSNTTRHLLLKFKTGASGWKKRRMPPKRNGTKRSRPETGPEDLLDENQKDEIVQTFQDALKNKGETTITIAKAKKCLRILGLEAKLDEIQSFFGRDQEQPMESLDETLFVRFAASKRLQTDKAYQAFELMDQDGKGVVVLEDLQRVAQDLGEEMTREELEEMIALADRSGDGLLTPQDLSLGLTLDHWKLGFTYRRGSRLSVLKKNLAGL